MKNKLTKALSSLVGAKEKLPPQIARLNPYSMAGEHALKRLYLLARDVASRKIAGDIVECGVWHGGSAGAIFTGFNDPARKVWLYDSFEGLPPPKDVDGPDAAQWTGDCVGSIDKVKEAMRIAGVAEQKLMIRKGWFENTLVEPLAKQIAFLHVDADWYDSVALCLNTFYDRVADGGVILLDDFGHWEGCREAFYDFVQQRKIKPLLERFGHTQAFWIKGRAFNRDVQRTWEAE